MLHASQGIVLRSIKYGETSLISTLFTRVYGVQAYLVQGIRSTGKNTQSRAGLLQPGTLLDIEAYQKPQKNLQRLKEFSPAYFYQHLQEEVVRNSIALFSIEILLRLLPEAAQMPELFDFTSHYFQQLDQLPQASIANFPIYFLIQCSRYLGYELIGKYTEETPFLNLREGGFTHIPPLVNIVVTDDDARALANLLSVRNLNELQATPMNAGMRQRLMEWYLEFLHLHTEHMGPIKSLAVLHAILH